MVRYTCDPELEFHGELVYSLFVSINHDVLMPFLAEHGLTEIDRRRWYPLKTILNVINDLLHSNGTAGRFVSIGMKAIEHIPIPPKYSRLSFEEFMFTYDTLYQSVHRNGDPGQFVVEWMGKNHLVCRITGPHPDDIMYGVVFGYARRFLPPHVYFTVYYDETIPRRDQGGGVTVIHVAWE